REHHRRFHRVRRSAAAPRSDFGEVRQLVPGAAGGADVRRRHARDQRRGYFCLASIRLCFFFFQAEDGIRDYKVTGVQTCALPILEVSDRIVVAAHEGRHHDAITHLQRAIALWRAMACPYEGAKSRLRLADSLLQSGRSEERRVGKEWRARGGQEQERRNEM